MRISLGLKPLAMDSTKEKEDQAARAAHEKKRADEKQAEAAFLAQRVQECAALTSSLCWFPLFWGVV